MHPRLRHHGGIDLAGSQRLQLRFGRHVDHRHLIEPDAVLAQHHEETELRGRAHEQADPLALDVGRRADVAVLADHEPLAVGAFRVDPDHRPVDAPRQSDEERHRTDAGQIQPAVAHGLHHRRPAIELDECRRQARLLEKLEVARDEQQPVGLFLVADDDRAPLCRGRSGIEGATGQPRRQQAHALQDELSSHRMMLPARTFHRVVGIDRTGTMSLLPVSTKVNRSRMNEKRFFEAGSRSSMENQWP